MHRLNRLLARSRAACTVALLAITTVGCGHRTQLPLVLLPPLHPGTRPLVLLLSGDGDWSTFTGSLARALNRQGFPVLGLRSRTYTLTGRTPDEAARDLEQATRRYLRRWHRDSLILVGYSRGADLIPFVFNRWPADLRRRVRQSVFIGMHEWAGFRFHLLDLLFEVRRPGDLPVRPELARMQIMPQTCVRGTRERGSLCSHPLPCMQVVSHEGGHLVTRGAALIRKLVRLVEAPNRRGSPAQAACASGRDRRQT